MTDDLNDACVQDWDDVTAFHGVGAFTSDRWALWHELGTMVASKNMQATIACVITRQILWCCSYVIHQGPCQGRPAGCCATSPRVYQAAHRQQQPRQHEMRAVHGACSYRIFCCGDLSVKNSGGRRVEDATLLRYLHWARRESAAAVDDPRPAAGEPALSLPWFDHTYSLGCLLPPVC